VRTPDHGVRAWIRERELKTNCAALLLQRLHDRTVCSLLGNHCNRHLTIKKLALQIIFCAAQGHLYGLAADLRAVRFGI
jgi:hypothetical protein